MLRIVQQGLHQNIIILPVEEEEEVTLQTSYSSPSTGPHTQIQVKSNVSIPGTEK